MTKQVPPKTTKPTTAKQHAGEKSLTKRQDENVPHLGISGKETKAKSKRASSVESGPLLDTDLGSVPGIPDDEQLNEAIGPLTPTDADAWQRLRKLLAEHLGSDAAGRLWLVTASPGFATTPLDEVRNGKTTQLLAMLESQWSESPTYA